MKQLTANDKRAIKEWEIYFKQYIADVEVDSTESEADKQLRIKRLEADDEAWFKYYFPKYCTAAPAEFHIKATKRLFSKTKHYEVRAWSRELAKSARSMFEILKLSLTGQVRNVLLVSNSYDNAERLLSPFRLQLEFNSRIINDYGEQKTEGKWEAGEFTTKSGCAFRALGAGQSPRGTRNEEIRPDFILIDDIDTDEECRNPERIKTKWDWIERALIPTLSVSGKWRVLFNGNIIAKDCCITRAIKVADHTDIINIRDKNGKSSWDKNSEADIDAILSKLSTKAIQGEYYNNPVSEGTVFREMEWGVVPNLKRFKFVVFYGDPSPSNRTTKANSSKSLVAVGYLDGKYYVIDCRCLQVTNAEFVQWFYDMKKAIPDSVQVYSYIENNSLQDPFYEQVITPLFREAAKERGVFPILPDDRKKPDKYSRIEGNLEPLNRNGILILNIDKKDNPHFMRLEESFLLLEPKLSAPADGCDAVEGAVWKLNEKIKTLDTTKIKIGVRRHSTKRI